MIALNEVRLHWETYDCITEFGAKSCTRVFLSRRLQGTRWLSSQTFTPRRTRSHGKTGAKCWPRRSVVRRQNHWLTGGRRHFKLSVWDFGVEWRWTALKVLHPSRRIVDYQRLMRESEWRRKWRRNGDVNGDANAADKESWIELRDTCIKFNPVIRNIRSKSAQVIRIFQQFLRV